MTQHSSAEIGPTQPTEALPLLDRPLVADEQKTVVNFGLDGDNEASQLNDSVLAASAAEIRERLFPMPGHEQGAENGLRIGHFEVEERIGSGGMGAVFRAVDLELARFVALKVLHPAVAADPSLVARFRNEARACAQLNHDNVARVFYAGEQDGVHYIAYEFAEGPTLKDVILQRGSLTSGETVNYAIQVTLALSHISAAGIVHRDIKPSNIILTPNGRIKVVDLGLARRETTDSVGDITVAGTTLGTFDYIAPEQARDPRMADIRSDIYSLGCTVYHMLTGQPPYPEGTPLQKLLDHQGKSPPDPRLVSKDIPNELAAILQKMMNTNPDLRYQHPGQLLADLIALATRMGLRSVPADGIVWRRVPVRRVRDFSGTIFVTGAVLAMCATALVLHFTPAEVPSQPKWLTQLQPAPNVSDGLSNLPVPPVTPADRAVSGTSVGPTVPVPGTTLTPESPKTISELRNIPLVGNLPLGTNFFLPNGYAAAGAEATPGNAVIDVTDNFGRFRVQPVSGEAFYEDSLLEAISRATSGDEILLQFNDVENVPPLPRLGYPGSENVTLRAAPGFRPVLRFQGGENRSSAPGRLFHLGGSLNLRIIGVDLQIVVRNEVISDQWVMFECSGPNRIDLQDCTIEVQNPSRRPAAVIRLVDSKIEETRKEELSIRLRNVSVRGAADLMLIAGQPTGRFRAEHCMFALDGSLLNSVGAEATQGAGLLDCELVHTTVLSARPVIQMADSETVDGSMPLRILPVLKVQSKSCVYASLAPGGTMVKSLGNAFPEELEELLVWNGSHNLYYQFAVYWKLEGGGFEVNSQSLIFEDWVDRWNRVSSTSEHDARELPDDAWESPDLINSTSRSEIVSIEPTELTLNRAAFFSPNASFRPDEDGLIPGADVSEIRSFPGRKALVVTPVASSEADEPD